VARDGLATANADNPRLYEAVEPVVGSHCPGLARAPTMSTMSTATARGSGDRLLSGGAGVSDDELRSIMDINLSEALLMPAWRRPHMQRAATSPIPFYGSRFKARPAVLARRHSERWVSHRHLYATSGDDANHLPRGRSRVLLQMAQ